MPAATGLPDGPDRVFVLRIGPEVAALVFDRGNSPVVELADEVGVEPVCRGLESERAVFAGKIAHPIFDFREAVKVLSAFEFFRGFASGSFFCQFAGLSEVMFFELEAAFV